MCILWAYLFQQGIKEGFYNYFYSFVFGLIPFFGGILALISSKEWGGLKSAVGKGVFFVGLGLFLWGMGENIWSYYNFFLNEAAPYPSWADLGFGPSIFFYCLGAFYLSKATGAKYSWRNHLVKIAAVIVSAIILVFSYQLLVVQARQTTLSGLFNLEGGVLKLILDFLYPFGGFIGLLLSIIISGLSFKYLGGRYKYDIYILMAGLAVMFIGDYTFSYTTTVGTYYNANIGDLVLATGTFLMTFGIIGFHQAKEKLVSSMT